MNGGSADHETAPEPVDEVEEPDETEEPDEPEPEDGEV